MVLGEVNPSKLVTGQQCVKFATKDGKIVVRNSWVDTLWPLPGYAANNTYTSIKYLNFIKSILIVI